MELNNDAIQEDYEHEKNNNLEKPRKHSFTIFSSYPNSHSNSPRQRILKVDELDFLYKSTKHRENSEKDSSEGSVEPIEESEGENLYPPYTEGMKTLNHGITYKIFKKI